MIHMVLHKIGKNQSKVKKFNPGRIVLRVLPSACNSFVQLWLRNTFSILTDINVAYPWSTWFPTKLETIGWKQKLLIRVEYSCVCSHVLPHFIWLIRFNICMTFIFLVCRVATHGYDRYISVKVAVGWGKKYGRKPSFAKSSLFWKNLHDSC